MRMLKLGGLLGFSIGYVLGAKAGRERYEQIHRSFEQVKSSPILEKAMGTAKNLGSRAPFGSVDGNGKVRAKTGGFGTP
jgi:hypothetical protein